MGLHRMTFVLGWKNKPFVCDRSGALLPTHGCSLQAIRSKRAIIFGADRQSSLPLYHRIRCPNPPFSAGGIRNTSSKSTSITASSSSEPAIKDNWDPWANWNPSLGDGSTTAHHSDSSDYHRSWSSKASQHSRTSTIGPASQASDVTAIQNQIRGLTKATKTTQDNEAKLRQDMQAEFTKVRSEMRTQIEASEQSLRTTLDQRIHCVERSLQETNTGMKEGFNGNADRRGLVTY